MNLYTIQKSPNFLDQIMKRMDETISKPKKFAKMDELALKKGTVDRKKLVLKFSQNNFKALVNDCANEKELLAEF